MAIELGRDIAFARSSQDLVAAGVKGDMEVRLPVTRHASRGEVTC
jgi:hypothetical protein